jgi:hypothetical protein
MSGRVRGQAKLTLCGVATLLDLVSELAPGALVKDLFSLVQSGLGLLRMLAG